MWAVKVTGLWIAFALGALACSGSVTTHPDDAKVGDAGAGGSGGGQGVAALTRVARLTHEQYRNTVRELLGTTDDLSQAFAPDALNGFEFDTSVDFRVDNRLGPQYRTVAEALAESAVHDESLYARVVPCTGADAACRDEFIDSFGQRAYRRPLTSDETARFRTLFEQGAALVASGDAFRDGVRIVVEAALQSPKFLYRTELAATTGRDGFVTLDSWELATRLSYALWNSMPDAELFANAQDGTLLEPAGLAVAAERLLADERALAKAVSFHAQAWEFGRYARITPDPSSFPAAPPDFAARARAASERFVREVIQSGGGVAEMLTAPYAFADSGLAPLYGEIVLDSLARIDFPDGARKGLLMQVGFLASNAYAIKTDPIHRGLFVIRRVLCRSVPDPPPGASMKELPDVDPPPRTTREEVALLTSTPDCSGCHFEINAPGFSFEGFDAVGHERTTENGVRVDTTGELEIDGELVGFEGAGELVEALAASAEARSCYATRMLEFVLGRRIAAEDAAARDALGATPLATRELLSAITATPVFTKRAPNEVEP